MISPQDIFNAAAKIIVDEGNLTVNFRKESIDMGLPSTRAMARELDVPHYYILPILGDMENDSLLRRVERIGMSTHGRGTKRLIDVLEKEFPNELEELIPLEIREKIKRILSNGHQ